MWPDLCQVRTAQAETVMKTEILKKLEEFVQAERWILSLENGELLSQDEILN